MAVCAFCVLDHSFLHAYIVEHSNLCKLSISGRSTVMNENNLTLLFFKSMNECCIYHYY